jgi:hypothetical protein
VRYEVVCVRREPGQVEAGFKDVGKAAEANRQREAPAELIAPPGSFDLERIPDILNIVAS